ncbi:MAG: hypothetical protein Q3971_03180 [Moraxella sp.]|nr:hypothetical protein [Moraxella sp.]
MAGASAGGMAKKSSSRFKVLRTVGKTKKGRYATKSEMKANQKANDAMKGKFKRAIAGKKGANKRAKSQQGSLF